MGGVLIVTWLGGGATQPAIGLGRELSARGHRVRISHGGMGSLLEAFRAGVPSVCVPLGRDQAENAAAAAEWGAAIALPGDATSGRLRAAITEALASPALRDGARRMAGALAACGGASAAADEVEQVAPCPGPRNLPRARGPLTPPSPLALRDGRGQRPARPGRTSGMTGPPG